MKLHRLLAWFVAIQFFAVLSAFGQGYKVAAIGAAPADVPAAIAGMLDSSGVKVTSDSGAALCEVWLRKSLPASSNPSSGSDVMYGTVAVGGLVGVIHLDSPTPDFRSQTIKAGYYTIRYELIPQDGNHMGVNPTRDAFVLSPAAADSSPDKVLAFEDVVKLSTQASGTPHPGFLVGAPVSGSTFPSVYKDDSGSEDLQLKAHGPSGDLPIAFTIVGHWQG